jgi:YggT family protein
VNPVGQVIEFVIWTFIVLMLVRFVVDWIQVFARSWTPHGPVLVVLEGVYSITDPPIKAFRRVFRPVRIGSVSLDLSFLAVLLICYLLLAVNRAIFLG